MKSAQKTLQLMGNDMAMQSKRNKELLEILRNNNGGDSPRSRSKSLPVVEEAA